MKSYLIKKLLFDIIQDKEKRENILAMILIPIVAFVVITWAGVAWVKTDMHLVTDKERAEAMKKGLPPPKSYWITEKNGKTYHLDFETEDLAKKHYEFQKSSGLLGLLLDYEISHGGSDNLSGGDYKWDQSSSTLPPYRPQQSLTSMNAGYPGQCTWYAADRIKQLYGIRVPALGNGGEWAGNAKRCGYRVDKNAKVGTAVCFPQGCHVKYVSSAYGHIAILEKINADGSIVCSEFWGSVVDYKVHFTTYSAYEAKQAWYIHFKK